MDFKLRKVKMNDAKGLFYIIDSQWDYLLEWLPFVASVKKLENTEEYLDSIVNQYPPVFTILVDKKPVGLVGYKEPVKNSVEIGYWLSQDYQGKGIITRCVKKLVNRAFIEYNFDSVIISVAIGNEKSRKIPINLGFILKGIKEKGEEKPDGTFYDLEVYELKQGMYDSKI